MNNIILITSRDLSTIGGERNLTKNKDYVFKQLKWKKHYISIRGLFKNTQNNDDFNYLTIYSIKSALININKIISEIKKISPEVVVFSGLISYIFFPLLNLKKYKTSLDYQGALEEIIEYNNRGIISKLIYYIFFYLEKYIYKNVDIIEIVSSNCESHLKSKYGNTKAKFIIVPCLVVKSYNNEEYLQLRLKWRKILSINENDIATLYAGGISKWQCIDDIMEYFNSFIGHSYFFTSQPNIVKLKNKYTNSNVKYMTLTSEELRDAMCAFDFGLLPRENDFTNFVAWPNKASEYYNARLTILLKNSNIGFYNSLFEACRIFPFDNSLLQPEKLDYSSNTQKIDIKKSIKELLLIYQN
jgi:hypothetical protein